MFKRIALAAALLFFPFAAHAITLTDGATGTFTTGAEQFFFDPAPTNFLAGQTVTLTFQNDTGGQLNIGAGAPGTVNPGSAFPTPADQPVFSFAGAGPTILHLGTIFTSIAAGDNIVLTILFPSASAGLASVDVFVSQVPLPAGILLIVSALAGLGWVGRRRVTAAATA